MVNNQNNGYTEPQTFRTCSSREEIIDAFQDQMIEYGGIMQCSDGAPAVAMDGYTARAVEHEDDESYDVIARPQDGADPNLESRDSWQSLRSKLTPKQEIAASD